MHLTLLGSVRVNWEEGTPPRFRSQRTIALLGYLAAERRPVPREFLINLFWPDEDPSKGRANLRRELHNLTQILPRCWQASRVEVQFVPYTGTTVDIYQILWHEEAQQLAETATLIKGIFLEGITLVDNVEFETWLLGEQERWRQRSETILFQLINQRSQQAHYEEALLYARKLLQISPWNEEVHYQVMLLLAKIGQRSAALKQYEECRQILAAELGVEPMPETVSLYERIRRAREQPKRHNLPADTTEFVGRENEKRQLENILANPQQRLITIAGLGGIGKTRLALAAAREQVDTFLEGVYFIPLTALESAVQLPAAISDALAIPLRGRRSPETEILNYLSDKELLLIFDSFEHLTADDNAGLAAALLTRVLDRAAEAKILLTSRERLKLQGEWVVHIDGLTYPQEVTHVDPAKYSAIELFAQSVRRIQPGYDLTKEETAAVSHICRLVDGSPLALELAAAWTNIMTSKDIAAEIQSSLDFLETDAPQVPARQRSIRAVFDATWRHLSEQDRDIFARLSIFRGSFSRTAAIEIAGATLNSLSALVNKACLKFEPANGRYHTHELLRQYGQEKLGDQRLRTGLRLAEFYYEYAHAHQEDYEPLALEWSNLMAGMRWAYEQERWLLVLDFAAVLDEPWFTRARFSEMRQGLSWAAEAAAARDEERQLAEIVARWGEASLEQDDYDEAQELLRKSLAIFQKLEQPLAAAKTQYHLARIAINRADYETAEKLLIACQATQEQHGDVAGLAATIYRRARVYYVSGRDNELAESLCQQALQMQKQLNDKRSLIPTLRLLAQMVRVFRKDYATARKYCEQARQLSEELQDQGELAAVLYSLVMIERSEGNFDLAETYAQHSLDLFKKMGNRKTEGMLYYQLGYIYKEKHEFAKACQFAEKSLAIFRAIGDEVGIVFALCDKSYCLRHQGKVTAAEVIWLEAKELADHLNNPRLDAYLQKYAN